MRGMGPTDLDFFAVCLGGNVFGSTADERASLAVLGVAAAYGTPVAAVAVAWLLTEPTVASPIAGARTPARVEDLVAAPLELTADEVDALDRASAAAGDAAGEADGSTVPRR